MRLVEVVNLDRRTVLGDRIGVAETYLTRLRGLWGRRALGIGEGLLLSPCGSVHMLGMRFAIDVVFLDGNRTVVGVRPNVRPGMRGATARGARYALELPAGRAAATATTPGDRLDWQETSAGPDRRRGSHLEAVS